ncbi:MAG: 1-deoxy-D-xylulose-5-phosphate synthase, partial [Actinomycetota bacterium]|nr:1-deoxy-D-xylulose-5-phosphate synthase [Actinomycetota bacterium]
MGLLDQINGPGDLRDLDEQQLGDLAGEIRSFLVDSVSKTGGHLGPNLGVVELTLAVHRVFDSPHDRIVFDTGHQAYVHKIITGRAGGFTTLRQQGGLSGYPSQAESAHDIVENSHASTSLSYADGLAKAYVVQGDDRHVVAVVGDGALTGGMTWEALNNIAAAKDSRLVIVVNDNGRSYTQTVGGLAEHLASLRTDPRYEQVLAEVRTRLQRTKLVGSALYDTLHAIKKGLKDALAPQGMFEDLGLKYIGPVDGHDEVAMEQALVLAKNFGGPVIVHAITTKGLGYPPAEENDEDNLHSVSGAFDPETGELLASAATIWTDVFREELVALGAERDDIVAVTAAMLYPTGIYGFAAAYPDRTFDVGIAEQHAVTSAAGMALAGLHPVVAIYATFLNRAFDQVLMDAALHRCGVTLVLDRAGVTGDDGPSHNGMWDMSFLQVVPGLRLAAPRDGARLREQLREAVDVDDAPTVIRMPKGAVQPDLDALERAGSYDVMAQSGEADVVIVAVGPMVATCLDVAQRLRAQGIGVTVVDPLWVKPVSNDLVELAAGHRLVVSVEDNGRVGGCGSVLSQAMTDAGIQRPTMVFGIPQQFLEQGKRAVILEEIGLTAQPLAREITARVAA